MSALVDEVAAADTDPGLGRRGCCGDEEGRKREERGAADAQAATFAGAATLRLNCIAPSSSGA